MTPFSLLLVEIILIICPFPEKYKLLETLSVFFTSQLPAFRMVSGTILYISVEEMNACIYAVGCM